MKTIYQKNMHVLSQRHPELHDLLTQDISTDHISVKKAKSGAPRLMVRLPSGNTIMVHNAQDPRAVARKTAQNIHGDRGVLVLLGMGLGYLAKALVKHRKPGTALIVYEADPGVFLTALHQVDLRDLLRAPKVKVVVGPEADVASWCCQYMVQVGGDVQVIRYEPAFRLAPDIYEKKLSDGIVKPTQNLKTNLATAGRFGVLFTNSILEAVPHLLTAQGVQELKGVAAGWPAIIVGAGPSLEKNIKPLQRAKGRAVIISADTVLGYLLSRGIIPDFVVSVDPQEDTYGKYQGVDIPEEVRLVFHPSCNDQIVKHFPGPRYVTDSAMPAYQWLSRYWPSKGNIEAEIQCQVHFGFNVAQCLGCDPIILTGQDLCYTDNRMHVKGGSYLSHSEEQDFVKNGIPTRNIFGETVSTYPVFLAYKHTWERKIAGHRGRVLNATEGGLPLEGADNILLVDALDDYCPEQPLAFSDILPPPGDRVLSLDWEGLMAEVRERRRDFFRLGRVSKRMLSLMKRIQERREAGGFEDPLLVKWVNQAERLTKRVPNYAKALGLLQMIDMQLELYMLKEETQAADAINDPLERLDQQLIRGQRYYGDLQRAAPILFESLGRLLPRLERLRQVENQTTGGSMTPLVRIQEYYALEMFHEADALLRTMGFDEKRREDDLHDVASFRIRVPLALNQLERACEQVVREKAQVSRYDDLNMLGDEVRTLWTAWQEKCRETQRDPSELAPPNPLERGNFYYRIGQYLKAAEHYRHVVCNPHYSRDLQGEASYRMAKAYEAQGDEVRFLQALEDTLCVSPSDSRVYFELAVLALQAQRLEAAERFFVKGAEVSLDDPHYCEAAGDVLASAGAQAAAIALYERALIHGSPPPMLLQKISTLYQNVFAQPIGSA